MLLGLSQQALDRSKAGQVGHKAKQAAAQDKLDAAIKEHSAAQQVDTEACTISLTPQSCQRLIHTQEQSTGSVHRTSSICRSTAHCEPQVCYAWQFSMH